MSNRRRFHLLSPAIAILTLFAFVPGLLAADGVAHGDHTASTALFASDWYVDHIAYLASDALEGRGPGQDTIDDAANYIADTFQTLGLEPAGDEGTYFQTFTLPLKNEMGEKTRLAVSLKDRPTWHPLKLKEEYLPFPFSDSECFKGDVVFAGYGISSDRDGSEYDDFEDVDVEGKVLLVLDGGPQFAHFRWHETSPQGKVWTAAHHDAAAVLVVNMDEDMPLYDFERRTEPVFQMASAPGPVPIFNIRRDVADQMLASAGLPSTEALSDQIEETRKSVSKPVDGVRIKGCADVGIGESEVRNVVGILPGSGPQADEYIVLGAHYDHHGIRNKGMDHFDAERDIYNGADDNASGVAMLMTLARVYANGPKPNRSLVFIAFTAEELGLLGSAHYTDHPTIDLDACVAMLNFDMVGRLHEDRVQVLGMRSGEFEEMVERLADRYSLEVMNGGARGSSDQSPFHDKEIPVLFFHTGIHEQYTQPQDDTERINGPGAMRIARLAADCLDEIDANPEPPPFHRDTSGSPLMQTHDEDLQGKRIAAYLERLAKRRAFLGVKRADNENERGFLVSEVMPGMAAERAGILAGDRIVQLGDAEITSPAGLVKAVQQHHKGDETMVVVERDGERHSLSVRFGEATESVSTTAAVEEPTEAAESEKAAAKRVRLGVRVKDDDEPGLLITKVLRDTPARWAGLQKGDRLVKLGDAVISTRDDLASALAGFESGDETKVYVDRDDEDYVLAIRFGPRDSQEAQRARLLEWVKRLDGLVALSEPKGGREISIESRGVKMMTTQDAESLVDSYCDCMFQRGKSLQDDVTISVKTLDSGESTTISVSVTLPAEVFRGDSDD